MPHPSRLSTGKQHCSSNCFGHVLYLYSWDQWIQSWISFSFITNLLFLLMDVLHVLRKENIVLLHAFHIEDLAVSFFNPRKRLSWLVGPTFDPIPSPSNCQKNPIWHPSRLSWLLGLNHQDCSKTALVYILMEVHTLHNDVVKISSHLTWSIIIERCGWY